MPQHNAPAAPAPAPRLAALKVQKPGASELNPAQRRFNRLLAQVDKLGQQRAHIEHLATVLRARAAPGTPAEEH
mgnify:CR=1 FL=1